MKSKTMLAIIALYAIFLAVCGYFIVNSLVRDKTDDAIKEAEVKVESGIENIKRIYIQSETKASEARTRIEAHVQALPPDGVAVELNTLLVDSRKERGDSIRAERMADSGDRLLDDGASGQGYSDGVESRPRAERDL